MSKRNRRKRNRKKKSGALSERLTSTSDSDISSTGGQSPSSSDSDTLNHSGQWPFSSDSDTSISFEGFDPKKVNMSAQKQGHHNTIQPA